MKISKTTLAAAIAATVCGCSGPRPRTDNPPPVVQAPMLSESLSKVTAEMNGILTAPPLAALSPVAGLSGMVVEPALCARLAGGQPKFDAQEFSCIVGWMRSAQDYLTQGGAPTKYTNQAEFDTQKKVALDMVAAQTKWLNDAKFLADARPVVPAQAPASSSQDLYLAGVIAFSKGDNAKAREAWTAALKLDPSNSDAQAGLELLDKRGL